MVSGLALSGARAPFLPSLSPVAEAAGLGTGRHLRSLSRHCLAVSPAPSLRSSSPAAGAAGPGASPRRQQLSPSATLPSRNQKLVPIWKEISQLQEKEIEMKKAAARGSKAEQKAKKQVEDEVTRLSANLKEKHAKALADGSRESKQSRVTLQVEASRFNCL
ncbi:uncharacterized protein LOC107615812 [Arachis ipaensis]|uniref:uncharacterized protein LOC107615812 n=1 Tax=Arachis ipaensis TaxID=130454 RepID=UPI000A2B014A|nr:uncharacterized protein LOC107615812 [Arachis ipaensis]XP_025676750.1 uncharacterized protein LOC112776729 [Arachis hypogaea]